jgi:hypothetical protein
MPTDRVASALSGRPLTGRAGFAGPHIRDLLVAPSAAQAPWLQSATLVTSAARLAIDSASGADALIAIETDGALEAVVLRLSHLNELPARGVWCGPWQRGAGSWTSRWLLIEGADEWMSKRRL